MYIHTKLMRHPPSVDQKSHLITRYLNIGSGVIEIDMVCDRFRPISQMPNRGRGRLLIRPAVKNLQRISTLYSISTYAPEIPGLGCPTVAAELWRYVKSRDRSDWPPTSYGKEQDFNHVVGCLFV